MEGGRAVGLTVLFRTRSLPELVFLLQFTTSLISLIENMAEVMFVSSTEKVSSSQVCLQAEDEMDEICELDTEHNSSSRISLDDSKDVDYESANGLGIYCLHSDQVSSYKDQHIEELKAVSDAKIQKSFDESINVDLSSPAEGQDDASDEIVNQNLINVSDVTSSEMLRGWNSLESEGSTAPADNPISRKPCHDSVDEGPLIENTSATNPLKAWKEMRRKKSKESPSAKRWRWPSNQRGKSYGMSLSMDDSNDEQDTSNSISDSEIEIEADITIDSEYFEKVESRRKETQVGSLKVEVLSCSGLAKFDRFSKPKITTYLICGDAAFATNSVASLSPKWLAQSKRAAEFPIYHAFAKLYAGVINATEKEHDDFAGRIVINLSSLRHGIQYDVTFPLKVSTTVYDRRYRGSIRLRFELQWLHERLAVLSYIPRSFNDLPWLGDHTKSDFVGIPCADSKTLKNVAFTVFGEDLPSKFSRKAFR